MLMRLGHRADHTATGASADRADAGPGITHTRSARVRGRRRDRRNRGIRGPLAPRAVPVTRSRAQQFDAHVLEAWDRLALVHPELLYIEIAVSDVPEPDDPALALFEPADAGLPARITVYRWALEMRASSPAHVRALLRDVLAEQAGVFLGVAPQRLDGGYPRV